MTLGNDGRASRRPMPRQLDMSGFSVDSSSTAHNGDRGRSASRGPQESDDFNYRRTREGPDRFDSFRDNEYQSRRTSAREEAQRQYEVRPSRASEFDVSSFSSGRSTIGGDTFTSTGTSRDLPRDGNSTSTYRSYRENRQDNQREVDDFDRIGSSRWDSHDELRTSNRSSRHSFRPTSERNDADFTGSSAYTRADSISSRGSFRCERSDTHTESRLSDTNADSIRAVESPATAIKASRNKNKESMRKAPESRTSSLASSLENQVKCSSPTNSERSIPPASPDSSDDAIAKRVNDRYPTPSIPSPLSSKRSTARRMCPSSPSSSVATNRPSTSRGSTIRSNTSEFPQRAAQSTMTDLREDLYGFRKQMREVFIRVEDMVDVHRSFFKSDPSTGRPVFREELQQEAEHLANETFEQLANLRKHFTRLAMDFQRSEPSSNEWSVPNRERLTRLKRTQRTTSSDDGNTSIKGSEQPEDDDSERLSVTSDNNAEASTMEHSPSIRGSSHIDSDDDVLTATMPDSTASTYLSSQLQSRWQKTSSADSASIAMSDISARTRTRERSPSLVSDQSSKVSEPESDSIFKDFDKRMEKIRCSLNAIASGQKPQQQHSTSSASVAAAPPKKITTRGAGSPIRAMMDATRTRSTLREASRISRRLDGGGEDNDTRLPGGREAELRHLLQELNHINTSHEDDDD